MGGLQITRRLDEQVVITIDGKVQRLTVEEFRGNRVRLRFHGDREFQVYREEIADKKVART